MYDVVETIIECFSMLPKRGSI